MSTLIEGVIAFSLGWHMFRGAVVMKYLFLVMVLSVMIFPSLSYPEHSPVPIKFEFSKTVSGYNEQVNNFSLDKDGIVYFSINATVQPSASTSYLLNFLQKCSNYSVALGKFVDNLGNEYGPFALEAGDYSIKTSVNSTVSTTYTTTVTYYSQLLPNDTEPNNIFPSEVQNLGLLKSASSVPGHIGYSCRSSYTDYDNLKFQIDESGDYYFKINHDQFEAQCILRFDLSDGMSPVTPGLEDVSGKVFGPYKLNQGVNYYWKVSLGLCQGGTDPAWFGGGAYEIQYSTVPPLSAQPFYINSVSVVPSTVFWGRDAKIQVLITNNTANAINNINIDYSVRMVSSNGLVSNLTKTYSLSAYQQREITVMLSEILGGKNNINQLREDKYSVTAWARQSSLDHESSQSGYFVFYKDVANIIGAIRGQSLLLRKGK
jgi:hypothetical protein